MAGCSDPGKSIEQRLAGAAELERHGEIRGAQIELKSLLQENQDSAAARNQLGRLYVRLGDGASAHKELSKALELGLDPAIVEPGMVEALVLQGKAGEALERVRAVSGFAESPEWSVLEGQALLRINEPESARISFQRALDIRPSDARALLGMGQLAISLGDRERALAMIEQSIASDDSSSTAHFLVGRLRLESGDAAGAVPAFVESARLNPLSATPVLGRARAHLTSGQVDEAETVLAGAKKAFPNNLAVIYYQALAKYRREDFKAAEDLFRQVLSKSPGHSYSQYYLGVLTYRAGNLEQAEEFLSLFLKANPDYLPVRKLVASIQITRKKFEAAIDTLGPDVDERDAQLSSLRATALLSLGEAEQGLDELKRAVSLAPDDGRISTRLALTQMALGQHDDAEALLESQIELAEETLRPGLLLVYTRLQQRAWDETIAAAEQLVEKYPEEASLYVALGLAHFGKDELPKARSSFERAVELNERSTSALRNLAVMDLEEGDLEAAERRIDQLAKAAPPNGATLTLAGRLAYRLGKREEAMRAFEKARRADPTTTEARFYLVRDHLEQGRVAEALSVAEEAFAARPDTPAVVDLYANALWAARRYPRAAEVTVKALESFPNDRSLNLAAGISLLNSGKPDEAERYLERLLELGPGEHATEVYAALTDAALKKGELSAAKKYAEKLRELEASPGRLAAVDGDIAARDHAYGEAVGHYETALESAYNDAVAVKLAFAHHLAGDVDRALSGLDRAMKQTQSPDTILFAKAQINEQKGRARAAAEIYQDLLERQPDSIVILNNLSLLKHQMGEQDAVKLAEKAHTLAPSNPVVADTLGWILLSGNQLERGLSLLTEAARQLPGDSDVRYRYAAALARTGNRAGAVRELEKALESPAFDSRQKARELYEQLKR